MEGLKQRYTVGLPQRQVCSRGGHTVEVQERQVYSRVL